MANQLVTLIAVATFATTAACGTKATTSSNPSPQADQMASSDGLKSGMFATEWLSTYSSWTPVLTGDKPLKSDGHGGIWVHSYLNEKAASHAKTAANPFPLPEGAVLAKAVVPTETSSVANDVTRVYFMKKEKTGYDLEHANWSYAVATVVNGQLKYDSAVGPRQSSCISCHAKFSEFDYVKTVDIYRKDIGK